MVAVNEARDSREDDVALPPMRESAVERRAADDAAWGSSRSGTSEAADDLVKKHPETSESFGATATADVPSDEVTWAARTATPEALDWHEDDVLQLPERESAVERRATDDAAWGDGPGGSSEAYEGNWVHDATQNGEHRRRMNEASDEIDDAETPDADRAPSEAHEKALQRDENTDRPQEFHQFGDSELGQSTQPHGDRTPGEDPTTSAPQEATARADAAREAVDRAYQISDAKAAADDAANPAVDQRNRDSLDRAQQGYVPVVDGFERPSEPSETEASDVRLYALPLPVEAEDVADRTTPNRVNLADDVPAIEMKPTYDGYLDLVIHGDPTHTQADVYGQRVNFDLQQTADVIRQSPTWDQRPIRLLSCSAGKEKFAQDLANDLMVPVYAPTGDLAVFPDGTTMVMDDGKWNRFEPDWYR